MIVRGSRGIAGDVRAATAAARGHPAAVGAVGAFLVAFMLYAATTARDILWQDSGLFVYRVWHRDLVGNLGLALAHPLYIVCAIVGGAVPLGGFAHRVNLVSAFFAALAVAELFLLVHVWMRRTVPALVAAVALAVSWTFWQHAVMAEVYTLFAAHLFTELLLLLMYTRSRRPALLYLLGFVNGLSVSNHVLALFGTVCYVGYVGWLAIRGELPLRRVLAFGAAILAGSALYLALIVRQATATGDAAGALSSAIFGDAWRGFVLNIEITRDIVLENFAYVALNMPTPLAPLVVPGIVLAVRGPRDTDFSRVVTVLAALYLVFAFRYVVADRYAFFLPFYCLAALFLGAGVDWLQRRRPAGGWVAAMLACALLPVAVQQAFPAAARRFHPNLGAHHERPFRDDYRYFLQPAKHDERSAARAARTALAGLPGNAVLYAFPTDVHPLLYMQEVEGCRPDIMITSALDRTPGAPAPDGAVFDGLVDAGRLFLFTKDRGYLPRFLASRYEEYRFVPQGIVYRVERAAPD